MFLKMESTKVRKINNLSKRRIIKSIMIINLNIINYLLIKTKFLRLFIF